MEDWTLRRADARDADALAGCIDAAYAPYLARIRDLPPVSEDCGAEIANNLVWVVEANGRIVGGLVLIPCDDFMLLANVAVDLNMKGAGIGRRLLTFAETEAKDRGYVEMRLNTHAEMSETIDLYLRNGWSQLSRNGTKISMTKHLLE